jgi:hypothetical protein
MNSPSDLVPHRHLQISAVFLESIKPLRLIDDERFPESRLRLPAPEANDDPLDIPRKCVGDEDLQKSEKPLQGVVSLINNMKYGPYKFAF